MACTRMPPVWTCLWRVSCPRAKRSSPGREPRTGRDDKKKLALMPRLFTGVEIPSDVGQALGMLRGGLPGARWVDPENYHLTLRFIGDVDDVVAHEVASLLGRVNRGSFELHLEGLTSFGGRQPRRVGGTGAPT